MTIFKYRLKIEEEQIVNMPHDAKILSLQMQGSSPVMWVMVDDAKREASFKIRMTGTGWPDGNDIIAEQLIGTVQADNGLVWHFFNLGRVT